jgi:hypothetical protein
MPQPGFYNDNEHRAYPFIFRPGEPRLPESAVVDAGFIMRIDSQFEESLHTVWLAQVARTAMQFTFTFRTNAHATPLTFTCPSSSNEWAIVYGESASLARTADNAVSCEENYDPVWEGFIVTGPLQALAADVPVDSVKTFAQNEQQIEPARIQNLNKGYVRTINVGNYERTFIPACGDDDTAPVPDVVLNKLCLTGDVKFKEGYNCSIRQPSWTNELRIGAAIGAGMPTDAELCANGSELPLFAGEIATGKFFTNGPACDDLIFTLNGLSGPNVTLLGGQGINIATQTDPPKITITRNINNAGNC